MARIAAGYHRIVPFSFDTRYKPGTRVPAWLATGLCAHGCCHPPNVSSLYRLSSEFMLLFSASREGSEKDHDMVA
jgi:hypothetical protein